MTSPIPAGLPAYQPTVADLRDDTKLVKTVQDFESLMINNVLMAMRKTVSFGREPSFADSTFYAMFDEKISQVLAEQGGFGLADAVKKEIASPMKPAQVGKFSVDNSKDKEEHHDD
jgi:Rod binding domain-containing protein